MKIRKILLIFSLFIISLSNSYAYDGLKIISRSEWGADESFRDQNSSYWVDIIASRQKNSQAADARWLTYSAEKKAELTKSYNEGVAKRSLMNSYLSKNFASDTSTIEYNKYVGGTKLAWAINKTNSVKNIVIHHTDSEYKSSAEGIKNIYKFHTLTRQWGDIGYNYIIGYEGQIYEGRAGGDYVVGAHDTWNNFSTVGISIMGNYDEQHLSDKQYESLKKLVAHLAKKYGIDLNNKVPYHKECFGTDCENGLETTYYYPIVGHRDGKATSCPGEHIYNETIPQLLSELQEQTTGYKPVYYTERQKEIAQYKEEIKTYNWEGLHSAFKKLTEKQQSEISLRINNFLEYEHEWKKEILYEKLLETISR